MINFLLGIVFGVFLFPILTGFIDLFNQWIDYLRASLAVKATKKQLELTPEEEEINTSVIGFQAPEDYYYEEEED